MDEPTDDARFPLDLLAGHDKADSPVVEEVLVDDLGRGRYRIAASPGLVLGIAAGDIIRLEGAGRFTVLQRAGNLCIQVFTKEADKLESEGAEAIARLNGRVDGKNEHLLVYTIPVSVGFPTVESTMNAIVGQCPPATWIYGNVYDDEGEPLGWWKDA